MVKSTHGGRCWVVGIIGILILGLLGGCSSPLRLWPVPFDPGGNSLNSPFAEQSPRLVGRYIVFVSDRRGSQDVYLYDHITRQLVELPGLNALDLMAAEPDLSDDGRWIVFTGVRQGRSGIYLYDRTTRQLRELTAGLAAQVRHPTISGDGSRIAFEASMNGQWDVVVVNQFGQRLGEP